MCPFQPRLLCAANKSNLAQNVTVNNKQSTYQSSYVSSGAGRRKNPYCVFFFIGRNNTCSSKQGQTKMNAWRGGKKGGTTGEGKREHTKKKDGEKKTRGVKRARKLFLNRSVSNGGRRDE